MPLNAAKDYVKTNAGPLVDFNDSLEIKKEPLLYYLYESLKNPGYISQAYLCSTGRRLNKIANVIVLLWSLYLSNSHDFHQLIQCKGYKSKFLC